MSHIHSEKQEVHCEWVEYPVSNFEEIASIAPNFHPITINIKPNKQDTIAIIAKVVTNAITAFQYRLKLFYGIYNDYFISSIEVFNSNITFNN